MSDQPATINQLTRRLEDLERRVDALEHPLVSDGQTSISEIESTTELTIAPAATALQTASVFALTGRGMLGIAGAYLLRAIAETGSLPKPAVAWTGIAYAFLWLVWAARTQAASRLAPPIYACTSVLILVPMLWELTLNFRLFPAPLTAAVLGAYAITALGFTLKNALASLLRVSLPAAAGLSLALAVASHMFLPFIAVLLMMVALVEFGPWGKRLPGLRALLALAGDAAVWMLIFIYFAPPAAHSDYLHLGRTALLLPGVALLLIAAASLTKETLVRRGKIGIFATIQTTIACLLASVSLADFGPSWGLILLGILCLVLSAAVYAAVVTVVSDARTSAVFAAWSAILLSCGLPLCLPPTIAALSFGAAAVITTFVGRQKSWISFEFYGILFLGFAAVESGLLAFIGRAVGSGPAASPTAIAGLTAICVMLCYAVTRPRIGEPWYLQGLHLAFAALAAAALVAFIAQGLAAVIAFKVAPGIHHLAFIRTLTLCTAALALVFSGTRWSRLELMRLGYAALVLVAIKLVAEDLRHGHLAYIAGSISLFAIALIAAPRLARLRQKA